MANSTYRILYIEDNPLNIRLIRKSLAHMGYEVAHAMDGVSGVQMAQQLKPHLILMDIDLPDMNGLEAAERIQQIPAIAHTPIVALTADATLQTQQKATALGFAGYLEKPVSRSLLLKVVMRVLEQESVLSA